MTQDSKEHDVDLEHKLCKPCSGGHAFSKRESSFHFVSDYHELLTMSIQCVIVYWDAAINI